MHPAWYLDRIDAVSRRRRRAGSTPTPASARGSATAAHLAAGAGLTAVAALREGRGDAAFCAVRPPGHHATPTDAMGFCLVSNIAVVAAALADAGERVWIFDYDAHHGNGTQAVFVDDPRVLFVSFHQWPLYPGTGRATEIGTGAGRRHDDEHAAAAGHDRRRLPARRSTRSSRPSSSASRRRGC